MPLVSRARMVVRPEKRSYARTGSPARRIIVAGSVNEAATAATACPGTGQTGCRARDGPTGLLSGTGSVWAMRRVRGSCSPRSRHSCSNSAHWASQERSRELVRTTPSLPTPRHAGPSGLAKPSGASAAGDRPCRGDSPEPATEAWPFGASATISALRGPAKRISAAISAAPPSRRGAGRDLGTAGEDLPPGRVRPEEAGDLVHLRRPAMGLRRHVGQSPWRNGRAAPARSRRVRLAAPHRRRRARRPGS